VGLVRSDQATVRNIRTAYRHYRLGGRSRSLGAFQGLFCHDRVEIEAVGVWDTVKALGLHFPIIWRWAEAQNAFHDQTLGHHVRHGFHALALNETREAYAPVLWVCPPDRKGVVEQMWFRGSHGDIGGQIGGRQASRPLSNIPLVWMLDRLEGCGLPLPSGWQVRFPVSPDAPSVGNWFGWSKLFLSRRRRIVGRDRSERLHISVPRDWRWIRAVGARHPHLLAATGGSSGPTAAILPVQAGQG
jgi:hypothetical protein